MIIFKANLLFVAFLKIHSLTYEKYFIISLYTYKELVLRKFRPRSIPPNQIPPNLTLTQTLNLTQVGIHRGRIEQGGGGIFGTPKQLEVRQGR